MSDTKLIYYEIQANIVPQSVAQSLPRYIWVGGVDTGELGVLPVLDPGKYVQLKVVGKSSTPYPGQDTAKVYFTGDSSTGAQWEQYKYYSVYVPADYVPGSDLIGQASVDTSAPTVEGPNGPFPIGEPNPTIEKLIDLQLGALAQGPVGGGTEEGKEFGEGLEKLTTYIDTVGNGIKVANGITQLEADKAQIVADAGTPAVADDYKKYIQDATKTIAEPLAQHLGNAASASTQVLLPLLSDLSLEPLAPVIALAMKTNVSNAVKVFAEAAGDVIGQGVKTSILAVQTVQNGTKQFVNQFTFPNAPLQQFLQSNNAGDLQAVPPTSLKNLFTAPGQPANTPLLLAASGDVLNPTSLPNPSVNPLNPNTPEYLFNTNADGTYAINSTTIGADIANAVISFFDTGHLGLSEATKLLTDVQNFGHNADLAWLAGVANQTGVFLGGAGKQAGIDIGDILNELFKAVPAGTADPLHSVVESFVLANINGKGSLGQYLYDRAQGMSASAAYMDTTGHAQPEPNLFPN